VEPRGGREGKADRVEGLPETSADAARWGEASLYGDSSDHYSALRTALTGDPDSLSAKLEASGLRGMGGAGFPTGRKWSLVAGEPAVPKYVICNADESEPGTFKDREILRDLPHLVLEGMALAGYCVGAELGFVFIRHEYGPERERVEAAIAAAQRSGALGDSIFGSDFNFHIEVFVSPGGYILGEETALLECMEDRRGEPRNKPPFPGTQGLWNQPTLMNNVETFAHATAILHRGVEWWHGLGKEGFSGHKFISVSGDVAHPGVMLVPFGTTLGELLERCGGMRSGCQLAAIAPGGASSNFLPPDRLDVPLDFDTLSEAGSMLGSGAAVFVAAQHDLIQIGLNVTRFFRNESCGKCVPCRVGSEKAVKLVESAAGIDDELRGLLDELNATMLRTSICGLGQVALGPLVSILENFPDRAGRR
jgi:NADH:ubiquinone oxidoreductase subunit F (NADH-binding)